MTTIVDSDTSKKIIDTSTGIQIVKGSITAKTSFFEAIILAYSNLVHKPAILLLGIVLVLEYISIEAKAPTPLIQIKNITEILIKKPDIPEWELSVANLILRVIEVLLKYELSLVPILFCWLPYFAKPSTNSIVICSIHSLVIFLMRDWHTFVFILLANFHYIFAALRDPKHKILISIIAVLVFYVGIEVGGKSILDRNKRSVLSSTLKT